MSAYKEFTVSPRLSTGPIATRLSSGALLLAMLLCRAAVAQEVPVDVPVDGLPFSSVVDNSSYVGQTPLRVALRTRGYGEETTETALGTHWATPLTSGLAFIDGQFRVGNSDTDFSVNLGGGFRWRNDDFFGGSPRIFGVSFWYDGEDTKLDNYFNQLGVSFERLGPAVDLRLNANIPLEDTKQGDRVTFTGDTVFTGNTIAQGTLVDSDVALRVVDFEIAPRLFNLNAWFYAGGYQMDGVGISEFGEKGGVRGYITNDLVLDVGVTDDDQFGTNTIVQVIWTPGRVTADPSSWSHNIDDRMREQVYRNAYVAVDQEVTAGTATLTDATGEAFRVVHVDSTAAAGGDGTIERPLNNLNDINGNSQVGDIVLAHSGSTFTGQSATIKDAQRFLGEGNNQNHTIVTSELGQINLPASSPGAIAGIRPIIQNSSAPAAVVLNGGNDSVENLAQIEVSNFTVTGGTRGIFSPTGVGGVNINHLAISNTTGDGIELTELTETLADNSTRVRFTPTITDVTFDNIGGDDVDLNVTTAEPATTPISEAIVLSDITSTNGDGVGIRLTETKRAATITDFNWNGSTTGEGALRIQNTLSTGTVTMNGTNTITGGVVGVAGEGYAINVASGTATHTVTGTTITNTGGDSIVFDDGVSATAFTAGMNFTGRIEQTANNASILSVAGGHDGNLTFTELTANAGVINATTGDGLQFNDADGVYTFNDLVNIVGTSSAINVVNDSSGVITMTDATITNTTGDAITFDGGTANLSLTGKVTQTANNASILSVTGGHDGTLAFTERTAAAGVINATTGDGLQFNNADGAYTFNDSVILNGGDAGIDVSNGSSGTFTFSDAANAITNPTGNAVDIQGSDAIFTYNGAISTNNASGRPVLIQNNTGGSITFNSTVTSTDDGILIQGNSGGTARFVGQVTLNTATQNGVTIQNNTGGTTRFDNLAITTTTGAGFFATTNTGTSAIEVTGAGNTITTTTGTGLSLNDTIVGPNNIVFQSVNVNGATNAIFLNGVTGGTVTVNGGTVSNTTGDAVSINNTASVTLNGMVINTSAGDGVHFTQNTGTSRLSINNLQISGTAGEGISMLVNGAATTSNLAIDNSQVTNTSGDNAIQLNTNGGLKTVNLLVEDSTFNGNSAVIPTAEFIADGSTNLNATVLNNNFNNPTGSAYVMTANNAATAVRLSLFDNNAVGNGTNDYFLNQTAGTFSVEDFTAPPAPVGQTTADRNSGTINTTGTITNDLGNIPTPENPD
jgi:hypothetical protein